MTLLELEYVIDIFEEMRALADPSEYLEEEAEEAINILRSLNLKEIDMTEENTTQEEQAFDATAYATELFNMLSAENGYAVGPEVLEHIVNNPVADADQESVSLALKNLIDEALAGEQEVAESAVEEVQDEPATEEAVADEPGADPVSV